MKKFSLFLLFASLISFISCETLKQTSNTTGNVFSLNGQWELVSNTPENTLIGSRVAVAAFIPEGKFTVITNNSQCFRENDIKWKNIASNQSGGFLLNNLLSSCTTGSLNYQPATITVNSINEIRLTGRNINGQDNVQIWKRIQ